MPDIKFSNLYPYTDFHELNLDWIIKEVKYWSTKVGKTIQSIEMTGTVGLVDTYTINYSDGSTSTFDVTNGNGIASVTKTGTVGLVDTYTITFQDGSTTTFEVTNGTASVDDTLTKVAWAADAAATGLGCARQIIRYPGYIVTDGSIRTDDVTRHYTNYIPCDPGEMITYQAETNHAVVAAITVYDSYGNIITNVHNAGANDSDHTYTTPANTAFIRFSFAANQFGKVVFTNSVVTDRVNEIFNRLNQVSEISTALTATTTTGKYIESSTLNPGEDWTTKLVNNTNSTYLASALDLSGYVGRKLKISMTIYSSGSTRAMGFCNSSNIVSEVFSESPNGPNPAGFSLQNGKYVTYLTITNTHFFFTVFGSSNIVSFSIVNDTFLNRAKENFYTKDEIDAIMTAGAVYVDGINGNDGNDGTAISPFKTIQAGVNAGAGTVYIVPGIYAEQVTISGRNNLRIIPTAYGTYSAAVPDTPKISINGNDTLATGLTISNSSGIQIVAFEFIDFTSRGMYIENSKGVEVIDSIAHGCWAGGFVMVNTDAVFRDCIAHDIGHTGIPHPDGFNIHGYGNTDFIHCVAYNCDDDGISHHDGCTGHIIGGEYYNCGKGGVASPTHGAYIDVEGVYSHDNVFGIYAENNGNRTVKGRISNCVFKNNSSYDIYISDGVLTGWNNIYDIKSVASGSTFTEY